MARDQDLKTISISSRRKEMRVFMIAGEHSGDALGGKLMAALNTASMGRIRYLGVGGEHMAAHGLVSQFPLSDVAVMGPLSILPRLPRILGRVWRTADAAISAEPDAVVIIDSPEFTHPIAKRIRKKKPSIPIINYVSPSVWAWRSYRAAKMKKYVDHVLALLPFEPDAHKRLGGPPCTYVGHPLIERHDWLQSLDTVPLAKRLQLKPGVPVVVMLPGSRPSEVGRMMDDFIQAIRLVDTPARPIEVIIPIVESVRELVEQKLAAARMRVHITETEEDKFRAFKLARVALAASGTVTLELALAGTPMAVAYKVDALASKLSFLVNVPSIVLPNLVLGRNVVPEYVQEHCTPQNLAFALDELLRDSGNYREQKEALAEIPGKLLLEDGGVPSERAAAIVLKFAEKWRAS
jgi:lipid-A-disaccharide synthase